MLYLTVTPDTYRFIKESGLNASRLMDHIVHKLRININLNIHQLTNRISLNQQKRTGLKGFEPLTYGLRVRRYA